MDLEVISFSRDQVQDWKWPQLYLKAGSNNGQQVLDFVAQMGQDYGKHPTLVFGMNYNDFGRKTKEFEQTGLISELYRRTDFVRFDCQSSCDFSTLHESGASMCFEGVTLFRKSQEYGYDSCETTSKLDVLLPYIPSGSVTSDAERQIEKSLQAVMEDVRRTKATFLIVVGHDFAGLDPQWQQQSSDAFARILLRVLVWDLKRYGNPSLEFISIVVGQQFDYNQYGSLKSELYCD